MSAPIKTTVSDRGDDPRSAIAYDDPTRAERIRQLNLIQAAPDLLAACKEFVRKCDCGEARSKRSYAQMKAAIAKAEEGQ